MSETRAIVVVRSRRSYASAAGVVGGLVLASLAAAACKGTVIPPMVPFILVYVPAVIGALFAHVRWWREQRGEVRVDGTGVWLDGRCLVARSALERADVMRTEEAGVFVRLIRRGVLNHDVDVPVASEEEARSLLRALRLDGDSSVADFRMLAGAARERSAKGLAFLGAYVGGMALDLGWLFSLRGTIAELPPRIAIFFGVFVALTLVLMAAFARAAGDDVLRVSVGADGVRVRSHRKTTFHPFATIAGARARGADVVLTFVDGTERTIHNPGGGRLRAISDRGQDAEQLAERIESQLASHRASAAAGEAPADAGALARNGRTAEAWIREASALRESKATFRTNVIPTEQLWRVLEDPTASVSARAGAALALRHDLDEPARLRLRVAADACAAPNLRVALETVAGEVVCDEELREAFEAFEESRAADEGAVTSLRRVGA